MNISVCGLGKLGLPIAVCFARAGHCVVGLDTDANKIKELNAGNCPVDETGLSELLKQVEPLSVYGRKCLTFTNHYDDLSKNQLHFIVVPTPSNMDGTFSLKYVIDAVECLGHALQSTKARHTIVITSTVMPGATGGEIRGALERTTGLHVGDNISLCYSPEFIALGSVIRDFCNPDFILIGESDRIGGENIESAYRKVIDDGWEVPSFTPVARTNWINAELAKLAVNTYVTTKITYANMLARICEQLPDGDVDEVTRIMGMDPRIGSKYLRGGAPFGGPCFPRDNRAMSALSSQLCYHPTDSISLSELIHETNRDLAEELLCRIGLTGVPICVVGNSYKLDTAVTEESLGSFLLDRNRSTMLWDGMNHAQCEVIVVTLPQVLDIEVGQLHGKTVVDVWRMNRHLANVPGVNYVGLGLGPKLNRDPSAEAEIPIRGGQRGERT